jgi:hypothetical protein
METTDATPFFTILKSTVEDHGCEIESVDFDRHVINLKGPDDAVAACAEAIANLLD